LNIECTQIISVCFSLAERCNFSVMQPRYIGAAWQFTVNRQVAPLHATWRLKRKTAMMNSIFVVIDYELKM